VEARNLGQLCFATAGRESIAAEESDLLSTIGQYLATALDRENTSCELRLAKEQLSDHAQHLEQKVHERTLRLEETISELETFSYTVAHDLKAPIRGMNGYCTILLEDMAEPLPARAKALVEKLARTTKRMETLTHDLLAFTKVSRQEVVLSRVEPELVIEDVLAMRAQGVVNAVTIRRPLAPVLAQRELLQQVLGNLVDNAIKFVKQDIEPRVTIYSEAVEESGPNMRSGPLLFSSPPSSKN
jgi:signal transduction histidine kinase